VHFSRMLLFGYEKRVIRCPGRSAYRQKLEIALSLVEYLMYFKRFDEAGLARMQPKRFRINDHQTYPLENIVGLFTYDLAHRLAGTNVTVNAFYPGIVKTPLIREAPAPLRWLNPVFGQSPEPVAQSVVYYASSPEVQGMTGLLFNKSRRQE
jgi:hypothetical protein